MSASIHHAGLHSAKPAVRHHHPRLLCLAAVPCPCLAALCSERRFCHLLLLRACTCYLLPADSQLVTTCYLLVPVDSRADLLSSVLFCLLCSRVRSCWRTRANASRLVTPSDPFRSETARRFFTSASIRGWLFIHYFVYNPCTSRRRGICNCECITLTFTPNPWPVLIPLLSLLLSFTEFLCVYQRCAPL